MNQNKLTLLCAEFSHFFVQEIEHLLLTEYIGNTLPKIFMEDFLILKESPM